MKLFVDTNAYSAFTYGKRPITQTFKHAEQLLFSPIVIGELRYGFRHGTRTAANEARLEKFLAQPYCHILPITEITADIYGTIFAAQRQQGKPIPTNDCWIAAHAIEHRAPLVSFDKHFHTIAHLKLIIPE